MVIAVCSHEDSKKFGKNSAGHQRYRCKSCGKTWLEDRVKPLGDMRISMRDATTALGMLLEGMSIRAVSRLTGLEKGTLLDLVLVAGENCHRLIESIQGVEADDVELDEIWSFVGMKERTRARYEVRNEDCGDSWTWIAIEANTKMVLAYRVGARDADTCWPFLERLRDATTGRFQVSADGLAAYRLSVPFVFRDRVDFGQLVKQYGGSQTTTRYSPAKIIAAERRARFGNPDHSKICTSHVERFNLSLRMHLRRFTRLTNGHSKSLRHHKAMQAIFIAWYNWCRKNEALNKQTPAMASKLTEKAWSIKELLENAASIQD